jgi:hypothetical protein
MGSFASLDALVSKMSDSTYADNLWWHHTNRVAGAAASAPSAGAEVSLWPFDGQPGSGAAPASIVYPTNVTRGGLKQTDPGGGRQKWLMGMSAVQQDIGTLLLYDRLAHVGGLSSSSTSNQSISSTITRYTNGIGNQIWLELTTAPGSPTSTTWHVDYTDENNASATTNEMGIGASTFNLSQRMLRASLAAVSGAGSRGVKNVTNFKLAATSGSGGDYAVIVAHPLAIIPNVSAGIGDIASWIQGHLPVEILTDACLALLYIPNSTVLPSESGSLHMVET